MLPGKLFACISVVVTTMKERDYTDQYTFQVYGGLDSITLCLGSSVLSSISINP